MSLVRELFYSPCGHFVRMVLMSAVAFFKKSSFLIKRTVAFIKREHLFEDMQYFSSSVVTVAML